MSISELPQSIWNKVSFQLSDSNISKGWKVVRNIAAGVFVIGGIIGNPATSPFVIGAVALKWVGLITVVSGVIAGRAQADTTKDKK